MHSKAVLGCLFLIAGFSTAQSANAPKAMSEADARQHMTADQEKAAEDWFPLEEKCMNAIKAQTVKEALDSCKETLDMSMKAGDLTVSTQIARTGSYQLYGHALLLANKKQAALAQEYQAVDEARKCLTDKDQEYAMPYFWRGVVEDNLGQNDEALADYTVAENTHRKAIANLPQMTKQYGPLLAAILNKHAALLDKMGRADEAAKLRAEAAGF